MLVVKILIGLAAVGLGVWLGLPGKYEQTLDDIERNMEQRASHSRKVKSYFTPLAWAQRKLQPRRTRRTAPTRRPFEMESPDDR